MDKTLLIMAAGMGSRFGGLKQIEPVGPNGEFIIDYSIYDALKAGFTKVVFVIKRENFDIFKETVGNRVSRHIKVLYAFQDMDDLPGGFVRPVDREKPWGTSHAILSAKDLIHENFAIINADDFYGRDAYYVVSDFLDKKFDSNIYCVVGYKVSDTLVSMNMLGFDTSIFNYIEDNFVKFLNDNKDNILKCEYLIPDTVFDAMNNGFCRVKLLGTSARWQGITYKEDKQLVVDEINSLIESGVYPSKLWD